jgi:hypothetical protein
VKHEKEEPMKVLRIGDFFKIRNENFWILNFQGDGSKATFLLRQTIGY